MKSDIHHEECHKAEDRDRTAEIDPSVGTSFSRVFGQQNFDDTTGVNSIPQGAIRHPGNVGESKVKSTFSVEVYIRVCMCSMYVARFVVLYRRKTNGSPSAGNSDVCIQYCIDE